ncbi:hypothetical protein DOS75_02825 [Staphylococcus felis]|nr:hypothetical protein DOS75_02825 [Staphylococcus felis]
MTFPDGTTATVTENVDVRYEV